MNGKKKKKECIGETVNAHFRGCMRVSRTKGRRAMCHSSVREPVDHVGYHAAPSQRALFTCLCFKERMSVSV